MPYYYRRQRNPNRWYYRYRRRRWRPRRRPYYWGVRKAFRRRNTLRRRKYRVRKNFFKKKKLKYLRLKQYQPQNINKCHIRGTMCLFQCGPRRLHYNNTQYTNTITPELWEGGGGWGQLKFTLSSLFEQRELLRNKWSKSNVAMPLTRYIGCTFKFWRETNIDYIVYYSTCLPMLDTLYQHINAHPFNMLLYKHKVIVRSLNSIKNQRKKPYKKLRIKPPEQYQNSWYFQADFATQGLVLITATAADFNRIYLNPNAISNSLTLRCLNTKLFRSHNFKQARLGTTFWTPNNNIYYYAHVGRGEKVKDLSYCGQTTTNTLGIAIGDTSVEEYLKPQNWTTNFAHILHNRILHDEVEIYISEKDPRSLFTTYKEKNLSAMDSQVTKSTHEFIKHVRYNPERDKGETNLIYIKDIFTNDLSWDPSPDPDLKTDGFPLWCLLWGWEDWIKKYKKLQNMYTDYILVIRTSLFSDALQEYVILDSTYIDGYSPYQDKFNPIDYTTWQPCLRTQMVSIENICVSGPLTCKTSDFSIEAHCSYDFLFKWGGCTNQLENITDPEKQKHYPTPHSISERLEIQDPTSPPEHEIYPFDFRRGELTKSATTRIKRDSFFAKTLSTDSRLNADPGHQETMETLQEEDETTTEEETETSPEQQLQQLRHHRNKLKRRINKLLTQTPRIKYSKVQ
nr:MAG: ORF1 [TTV-like mini virus]